VERKEIKVYIYNMRKINKNKVGFSIDIEVEKNLINYCDQTLVNKSRLVNKLIKEFLETKGDYEKENK
jgi:hypothetical protein